MGIIYIFVVPTLFLGVMTGGAKFALRPLDEARAAGRPSPGYTLADLACLVFWIQLPMVLLAPLRREQPVYSILCAYGFLCGSLCWWFGVRSLSRAGVRTAWHRAAVLLVAVPIGVWGSAVLAGALTAMLLAAASSDLQKALGWPLILAVGMAAALVGARRLNQFVLARAPQAARDAATEKAAARDAATEIDAAHYVAAYGVAVDDAVAKAEPQAE